MKKLREIYTNSHFLIDSIQFGCVFIKNFDKTIQYESKYLNLKTHITDNILSYFKRFNKENFRLS